MKEQMINSEMNNGLDNEYDDVYAWGCPVCGAIHETYDDPEMSEDVECECCGRFIKTEDILD